MVKIVYAFFYAISLLPFRLLYCIADFEYFMMYYVIKYRRGIVRKNLTTSFPEKSEEEIVDIEKKFYRWFSDYFFEAVKLLSISDKELRRRFKVYNSEEVEQCFQEGQDVAAILGHYSVAFTMDTYVHSMDEHKRREMDKMDDMFGMQYSISVENQPYPVLCTLSADGCTAHVPDFPKITAQAPTLDAALLEAKQQIEKALRQYKNPPIPTKQDQIVVPNNSVLVLVKAS